MQWNIPVPNSSSDTSSIVNEFIVNPFSQFPALLLRRRSSRRRRKKISTELRRCCLCTFSRIRFVFLVFFFRVQLSIAFFSIQLSFAICSVYFVCCCFFPCRSCRSLSTQQCHRKMQTKIHIRPPSENCFSYVFSVGSSCRACFFSLTVANDCL